MTSSSRYALIFGLLAVVCGIGASNSARIITALFILSAITFSLVALAYSLRMPALLGKANSGRIRIVSMASLFPFHVLNHLAFATYCRLDRTFPWQEIVPGLYLGRRLRAHEASLMPASRVLDLTSEFSEAPSLRMRAYSNVPMLDGVAPTITQLNEAVGLLRTSMQSGPTYVHCALGHGRSATVAVAFLIEEGYTDTVDDALDLIRKKRPSVRLSTGQRKLLETCK